jgi:hypothetical protein
MKRIPTLFSLCLLLFIVSCANKPRTDKELEADALNEALHKSTSGKGFEWLVLLPGMGCHGCIQEAEAFMRDNVNNSKIIFVLTRIESLKILQQKIGAKVTDRSNVYIDKEGLFKVPSGNDIYPCIAKLENGKVAAHEFQSPKNSQAFDKLKVKIQP